MPRPIVPIAEPSFSEPASDRRNVRAEMPPDHPRIKVVSAADAVADIEIDGATLVEIVQRVRPGNAERNDAQKHRQRAGGIG